MREVYHYLMSIFYPQESVASIAASADAKNLNEEQKLDLYKAVLLEAIADRCPQGFFNAIASAPHNLQGILVSVEDLLAEAFEKNQEIERMTNGLLNTE